MIRDHAVTENDCQSHVHDLLELSVARSNRTIELPQTIAFLTGLEQQIYLIRVQESTQATALDQNVWNVWV